MTKSKYTIKDFKRDFPDDNACLEYLFKTYYGGKDYKCPKCGRKGFYRVKKRRAYACSFCGYQVYPTANTIFHKSSTPLTDWFFAMFLKSQSKHKITAKELQGYLGCTYKTAWRINKKIDSLG